MLFFGMLIIVVSCKMVNKALINHTTNNFKINNYSNGDKEIAYLPMIHIAKPEFYDKVKFSVDSLRSVGYVVFFESIAPHKDIDSISIKELDMKLRKVVGFTPDYIGNEQFGSYNIKGFVSQTAKNTGVNLSIDVRADLPLDELIAQYEKEKGTILLSDYDLKTPLGKKYKGKVDKENYNFLIDTLRNNYLFKTVSESKAKKIAIVYGKGHMYALFDNLEKQDSLWRYVPSWEIREAKLKAVR